MVLEGWPALRILPCLIFACWTLAGFVDITEDFGFKFVAIHIIPVTKGAGGNLTLRRDN